MIIEAQKSNIELIGDIKEFKTGIDPKNLEFITTLLSSNLYSAPERSFIREIVSNAWDSHVEADNTNTPVLIKMDDDKRAITIRDFGVGLSPERFENIYCNIGSSTKRNSNDFIGGFGLGRFSALACTNVVYITSYYKGKAYYYIMTKDGNNITTNLVATLDTDEKDGVEVTIKGVPSMQPYYNSLEYIVFFPNIYVNGINADYINNTKIKRFTNFAVASRKMNFKLLLGNVLYSFDKSQISPKAQEFLNSINSTGIVVQFNIGEINITPNRESVIYTKETIAIIEDRIQKAKEEMYSIIRGVFNRDYTDLNTYRKLFDRYSYIDFIDNSTVEKYNSFNFRLTDIEDSNITYKGKDLSKDINLIYALCNMRSYGIKGIVNYHTFRKNISYYNTYLDSKSVSLKKEQKVTAYVRKYLEEKYNGYLVITECTLDEFKEYCLEKFDHLKDLADFDYLVEEAYNMMISNTTYIDFKTNQDFLNYKQELKDSADRTNIIRDVILYVYQEKYATKIVKRFNVLSEAIKYIKGIRNGVVISNIVSHDDKIPSVICSRGYVFIATSIPTLNELNKIHFTNRIDKDWVLNKDERLQIVYTVNKYFPKGNTLLSMTIPDNFPYKIKEYLNEIYEVYGTSYEYWDYACKTVKEEHPYWSYICKKVYEYLTKYKKVKDEFCLRTYLDDFSGQILDCYIMKSKLYRINFGSYVKLRSNKILKMLCRK